MSKLSDLKSQRAGIAARLKDVEAARGRLQSAEGEESAILAEIGKLGDREIEALSAWARSGEGPKPLPDAAARATLHERLVQAQLAAEQARAAGVSLYDDERSIGEEHRQVNISIEIEALDALERRHESEVKTINALIEKHVADRVARACALHSYLIERGQKHQASGRTDDARAFYNRAARVGAASPPFDITPLSGAVLAKIDVWSTRFEKLIADAPKAVELYAEPRLNNLFLVLGSEAA